MAASFSLAIIAGGKSSRMGVNKSFVDLGGKPVIQHIMDRTAELGQEETILITNQPADYAYLGLPMFRDVIIDKGSLGGIYTAVHFSSSPRTLVIACDMPFVATDLLCYMISLLDEAEYDVIVPRVDQYPQGLHAIYSKQCLEPIAARLREDRLKVIGFYEDVRCRFIDEAEYHPYDRFGRSFMNINTPEELAEARKLIAK
jgi:molybdopterin-guanine dinucleotide biosynthesis protein A